MHKNKNIPIKLAYLFEPYPVFFQPYIKPIVSHFNSNVNYTFKVYALKKSLGKTYVDKLEYLTTNYRKRKINQLINNLIRRSKAYNYFENKLSNYDIIHIQHSFLFSKFKTILNQDVSKRPKFVITLRGSETYIKPYLSKRWKDLFSSDMLDAYIVMSENQKKKLIEWGVSKNKIHVIPISNDFEGLKQNEGIKHKKESISIVSVFRLCWEKNIFGNLMVIFHLKKMGHKVNYTIYGDGEEKGKLLYLIDYLNLNDIVDYKGKKPKEEIINDLHNYNFYLQLSLSESLGMSVIEAQSMGLPCLVSKVGGLGEIVIDGETGYLVQPFEYELAAELIFNLYENIELYKIFSSRSVINSKRFEISNEIEKLDNLYTKLMNINS